MTRGEEGRKGGKNIKLAFGQDFRLSDNQKKNGKHGTRGQREKFDWRGHQLVVNSRRS